MSSDAKSAGAENPTSSHGYVGFANLPNQVHRKSVKKGFEFTLMVVGESGLGKSTLVNSLFQADLYNDRKIPDPKGNNGVTTSNNNGFGVGGIMGNGGFKPTGARINGPELTSQQLLDKFHKNVQINAKTVEIEERGVKLRLTVVDTPGFGDAVNNENSFQSIVKYIDDQFEKFFHGERGLNRRNITDSRVHCCFYFISPFGHGLKPLDVEFMKQLHQKVNIVPVISRADAFTKKEVTEFKKRIRQEIQSHGIKVYTLPEVDEDEDQDYKEEVRQMKEAMPFAVSGSTTTVEAKGKKLGRVRVYPWGVVEIENPEHSLDFIKLRHLITTHMQDLQEVTQEVHYENYRLQKLAEEARAGVQTVDKRMVDQQQGDSATDKEKMKRILDEKEAELRKMHEIMAKMQAEMTLKSSK